jgi:hypothetical protein
MAKKARSPLQRAVAAATRGLRPSSAATANVGKPVNRATRASTAAAQLGKGKAEAALRAAALFEKPTKPKQKRGQRPVAPPAMTASYVMGVKRRPVPQKTRKAPIDGGQYARLLREAASLDVANEAVAAAMAAAHESSAAVRGCALAAVAAMKTDGKDEARMAVATRLLAPAREPQQRQRQQQQQQHGHRHGGNMGALAIKACGTVARAVTVQAEARAAARAVARAEIAKRHLDVCAEAWEAMVAVAGSTGSTVTDSGKRSVVDTLPVGHKLKQLCRSCGANLSDEVFGLLFNQLGGVGAMVDFETFMHLLCEHSPMREPDGSEDAASTTSRHSHSSSARERPRPIRWSEFCMMVLGADGQESPERVALTEQELLALFRRCGASGQDGELDRQTFEGAASAEMERRARKQLKKKPDADPLEA